MQGTTNPYSGSIRSFQLQYTRVGDFLMSVWDRREGILYSNGLVVEVNRSNPTPECKVNGTKCYDGWVWVIYLMQEGSKKNSSDSEYSFFYNKEQVSAYLLLLYDINICLILTLSLWGHPSIAYLKTGRTGCYIGHLCIKVLCPFCSAHFWRESKRRVCWDAAARGARKKEKRREGKSLPRC